MKDRKKQDNSKREKHEPEEIYENIGKYESLSTEIAPVSQFPEQETDGKKGKKKKLTRKERKEIAKQQAEYEKELVKEGKIAPRYRYVPRNGFARIVSVCVAFVIGFFAAFGVLVGGLAIFGDQKKIKDVADIAGFDYNSVFTDYSAELSTLDFITEIVQSIKNGEFKTLGDVGKYISFADKLADSVVNQLTDAGITAEKDELMATSLTGIGNWLQEKLSGASADDYVNTHTLGQALTINEDSPYLLQSLKDTLLCNLGEETRTLPLGKMLRPEELESNKILRNLKESTLDSLSSDIENLTVEQVFGDEMYSYLSKNDYGGKTYQDIVDEYDPGDENSPVPRAVKIEEGDEIVTVDEDGTVRYYLSSDPAHENELDRFLDGTWYLLFGESEESNEEDGKDKTDTPILEMSANVSGVIKKVNEMPLHALWLHGIINQNPYSVISYNGKGNLNELTIPELIQFTQFLTQNP